MGHRCNFISLLVLEIVGLVLYPKGCEGTPTVHRVVPFDATADAVVLRVAKENADMASVINVVAKRVSSQRQQIAQAYSALYTEELIKSITIDGDFGDVMKALLTPIPDYCAKELYYGIHRINLHDHDDVVEILCPRSDSEVREITSSYEKLHNTTLESDVGESSNDRLNLIYRVCVANRNGEGFIDEKKAYSDARSLKEAGDKCDSANGPLTEFFASSSYRQLLPTMRYHRSMTGGSFEKNIREETLDLGYDQQVYIPYIARSIESRYDFFADILYDSVYENWLDTAEINRVVITRSEIDLCEIKRAFEEMYFETLETWISRHVQDRDHRRVLLALVSGSSEQILGTAT